MSKANHSSDNQTPTLIGFEPLPPQKITVPFLEEALFVCVAFCIFKFTFVIKTVIYIL